MQHPQQKRSGVTIRCITKNTAMTPMCRKYSPSCPLIDYIIFCEFGSTRPAISNDLLAGNMLSMVDSIAVF